MRRQVLRNRQQQPVECLDLIPLLCAKAITAYYCSIFFKLGCPTTCIIEELCTTVVILGLASHQNADYPYNQVYSAPR